MPLQNLLNAKQPPLNWATSGLVAGVDEAGRGPLAGPVVAAAVILDAENPISGLADSKKLTEKRRLVLYEEIRAKALCCSIALADVTEIDQLNILHATMLAMKRAIENLRLLPAKVLVDGNRVPQVRYDIEAIVGGDNLIAEISAASILAKVYRDQLLIEMSEKYPEYGFIKHKGYGTKAHLDALKLHGSCPEHRHTFAPVRLASKKNQA